MTWMLLVQPAPTFHSSGQIYIDIEASQKVEFCVVYYVPQGTIQSQEPDEADS